MLKHGRRLVFVLVGSLGDLMDDLVEGWHHITPGQPIFSKLSTVVVASDLASTTSCEYVELYDRNLVRESVLWLPPTAVV